MTAIDQAFSIWTGALPAGFVVAVFAFLLVILVLYAVVDHWL